MQSDLEYDAVLDDESFTVAADEAVAARRRVMLQCIDDLTRLPLTGLTFALGEIKVDKLLVPDDGQGTVTELGGGFYFYEMSLADVPTAGPLVIRTQKQDVIPFEIEVLITGTAPAVGGTGTDDGTTIGGFSKGWFKF